MSMFRLTILAAGSGRATVHVIPIRDALAADQAAQAYGILTGRRDAEETIAMLDDAHGGPVAVTAPCRVAIEPRAEIKCERVK